MSHWDRDRWVPDRGEAHWSRGTIKDQALEGDGDRLTHDTPHEEAGIPGL